MPRGVWFAELRASAVGSCQLRWDRVAHSPKSGRKVLGLSPSAACCWLCDLGQVLELL